MEFFPALANLQTCFEHFATRRRLISTVYGEERVRWKRRDVRGKVVNAS